MDRRVVIGDREVIVKDSADARELLEASGGPTTNRNLVKVNSDGTKEVVTGKIRPMDGEQFENVPSATYGSN